MPVGREWIFGHTLLKSQVSSGSKIQNQSAHIVINPEGLDKSDHSTGYHGYRRCMKPRGSLISARY